MRNKSKQAAILLGALFFLAAGVKSVIPAEAAFQVSNRAWTCNECGTKLIASTERKVLTWEKETKCNDSRHDRSCWICRVIYADVHSITCPNCNITEEQNTDNYETKLVHLTL